MKIEVTSDGSILINGQLVGRTNNPNAVKKHLARR